MRNSASGAGMKVGGGSLERWFSGYLGGRTTRQGRGSGGLGFIGNSESVVTWRANNPTRAGIKEAGGSL